MIARATHYYVITAARTALDSFTIVNTKGDIMSAKKYFIIKRTLFLFKKKFAITSNKRKYLERINI